MRFSRHRMSSVGAALVAALLSLSVAKAEGASDNAQLPNWDEVFAQVLPDKISIPGQTDWLDASALGYARSARSDAAAVRWIPQQPLPAVDGINGKIDGWGGGGNGTNGFYGGDASLSIPLAQQWGLQLDGFGGSDQGIGDYGSAAHLFWRDPSIGLLGAYVSYSHDNGFNDLILGHISTNTAQYAAEGEYYLNRWTLSGVAGVETGSIKSNVPLFFGGGRMASLFTQGWIGEGGDNGALVGLRIYFGQRDKSLIDRHRQDDPIALDDVTKSLSHKLEIKPQDQILLQQALQKLTLTNQLQSSLVQQQGEALQALIRQIK